MKANQTSDGLNSLFWPTMAWVTAWRMVAVAPAQQEAKPIKKRAARKPAPAAARPAYILGTNVIPFPLEQAERRPRRRIRTSALIIRLRTA